MGLPRGLYRRNGRYIVRLKRDNRWSTIAVGPDLGEALRAHARLRGEPERKSASLTLAEIAELWLKEHEARSKPRTVQCARNHAARLVAKLRVKSVDALTPGVIDRFIARRRAEGVTNATINSALRALKAMLRSAVASGALEAMPARVKLLRAPARKDVVPFTQDELARVMAVARPKVRALLCVAAGSGLRTAEILWLRWDDLEPDGTLHVRPKTDRVRHRGQWLERSWSPKSHQERSVVLPASVLSELERYRATLPSDAAWMFPSDRRAAYRWAGNSRYAIRKDFEVAGVYERGRLVHAIRHSFATSMARAGVDLESIRIILGHSSIVVTQGYLHTDRARLADAARRGSLF